MLLNQLAAARGNDACRQAAKILKRAYNTTLSEGRNSGDLGGNLSTSGFADAVIERCE